MPSDLMIAALTQRLERLEVLTTQQGARIVEQDALIAKQRAENAELREELKEWRSGVRIRARQKQRRRVRRAKEARDAAESSKAVGTRWGSFTTGPLLVPVRAPEVSGTLTGMWFMDVYSV